MWLRSHVRLATTSVIYAVVVAAVHAESSSRSGNSAGNVKISKPTTVTGDIRTRSLYANSIATTGNVAVNGEVSAKELTARRIVTDKLEASVISSPTGVVTISGNLALVSSASASASSFLEQASFVKTKGEGGKVWTVVAHDHFDYGAVEGWSDTQTSHCGDKDGEPSASLSVDRFLGGHCNIATGNLTRLLEGLPDHRHVKISASLHQIDKWNGEVSFATVDGKRVWATTSQHHSPGQGIDMCGGTHSESQMAIPVEFTVPHTRSSMTITFGSTGRVSDDPCERSFGVDDLEVRVK
eukprot:jgi/Bigna1/126410/aug1.2_g1118